MAEGTPFNIENLKKALGPGLGLRKARYLVEVPISETSKLNFLCMSTSLPERNMSTTYVWYKGRKVSMRGETEFPGTYEVSIVDDSNMKIRVQFDQWMSAVDNTNYGPNDTVSNGDISIMQEMTNGNFKRDVSIWQLANDGVTTVRGYLLQGAFPSSIGTVTLDDSDEATLSEFSIVFNYSEFIPLSGGEKKG